MPIVNNKFFLRRLSIQQRLPLLICALLLSCIVVFSLVTYYGLKKATLTIGEERLHTLTDQVTAMLSQSTQSIVSTVNASARQNSIKQYILSGGNKARNETLDVLAKLHRDSTWVYVGLLDSNKTQVLLLDKSTSRVKLNIKGAIAIGKIGPGVCKIGKIYTIDSAMYYPVIASVTDSGRILGYIECWQQMRATPKAVDQLSKLMGTGIGFYIVNNDGSLWTDMVKPVKPLLKIDQINHAFKYLDHEGNPIIARAGTIANSSWVTLVQVSQASMLEGVKQFLDLLLIAGALLTGTGMLIAWVMSRNITRPLNQLTAAAKSISGGNYSTPVPIAVYRHDELGELAFAFNIMASDIHHMWQDLDNRVKERTSQLERVNKELEAFSYSVSHDLRTPLRAINGYSIMLKEDYEGKLDAEGRRIIGNIITNAKMMGQLIDDLLAFSRLGKKELVCTKIDMQLLATNVVNELLQNELEKDYRINIGSLPPVDADPVMIKQVFINLVGNALKYSSKKADPEINIGARDEGTKMIYYVKDNGVGFDMAYAGKLFGVFQRLHSQEEFEGTGVGLALVKRIVDKHKGEVWAEGQENIGATFYFSLPKKSNHGQ